MNIKVEQMVEAIKFVHRELLEWYDSDDPVEEARLVALLAAAERLEQSKCKWIKEITPDGDCCWSTSCGEDFCLVEGGPKENSYRFCPRCGGKINEMPLPKG